MRAQPIRGAALALVCTVGVLSCATAHRPIAAWQWEDATAWLEADADDGRSSYVTLLHDERYTFLYGGKFTEFGRTEIHRHTVHKILSEAAFDAAEVTVDWPRRGALLQFEARTVAPDGTVVPVDSSQLFDMSVTAAASGEWSADRWRDSEVRRFRFPRVEVGSLIELVYTVAIDSPITSWSSMISGPVPIKKYRAEIVVEPGAQPDLMVINKSYPLKLEPNADGMQHLVLEATDVPAAPREVGGPIARAGAPWWMYRTIAYRMPNRVWNMNGTWDDVMRSQLSSVLLKKKMLEGLPALVDGASCAGDQRCLIAKALKQMRAAVAIERTCDFFELRKVQEIVDDGYGSSCDRALVVWALLKRAGLEVYLAGATQPHTLRPDRTFPTSRWLNQPLVVAVVGGEKLWLDPDCQTCGPGELSAGVARDSEAVVAVPKGTDEVSAQWWPVRGPVSAAESVRSELWRVMLEPDGSAKLELDERRSGETAWRWHIDARTQTKKEHADDARASLRRILPTAHMKTHEAVRCDEGGVCKRSARGSAKKLAAVEVDSMRVELRPLGRVLNLEQDEARVLPFVVGAPMEWFTEVRFTPPPGMRIAAVPEARTVKAELLRVDITAQREQNDVVVRRVVRLEPGKVAPERVASIRQAFDATDLSSTLLVVEPAK